MGKGHVLIRREELRNLHLTVMYHELVRGMLEGEESKLFVKSIMNLFMIFRASGEQGFIRRAQSLSGPIMGANHYRRIALSPFCALRNIFLPVPADDPPYFPRNYVDASDLVFCLRLKSFCFQHSLPLLSTPCPLHLCFPSPVPCPAYPISFLSVSNVSPWVS